MFQATIRAPLPSIRSLHSSKNRKDRVARAPCFKSRRSCLPATALDLIRVPYVLYGVKYIDLVSLAPCAPSLRWKAGTPITTIGILSPWRRGHLWGCGANPRLPKPHHLRLNIFQRQCLRNQKATILQVLTPHLRASITSSMALSSKKG